MKVFSLSSFACAGKTTLLESVSINKGTFFFAEHAQDACILGEDFYFDGWLNRGEMKNFQVSVMLTEFDRLKTLSLNSVFFKDATILMDRSILDVLTFYEWHRMRNHFPGHNVVNLIRKLSDYLTKRGYQQNMIDINFVVRPTKNEEFVRNHCLREDRNKTISFESFKHDEEEWFEIFMDIWNMMSYQNFRIVKKLEVLDHPADIGFTEFRKNFERQIQL